jgi:hypothetical protein
MIIHIPTSKYKIGDIVECICSGDKAVVSYVGTTTYVKLGKLQDTMVVELTYIDGSVNSLYEFHVDEWCRKIG